MEVDFEKITDPQTANETVKKYAEAIISALPPKQAELHRMGVFKMCELLYDEATINARIERLEKMESMVNRVLDPPPVQL